MPAIPKPPGQKSLGEKLLTVGVVIVGIWGLLSLLAHGSTTALINIIAVTLPVYGPWTIARTPEPDRRYLILSWIIGAGLGFMISGKIIDGIFYLYVFVGGPASIAVGLMTIFWYAKSNNYLGWFNQWMKEEGELVQETKDDFLALKTDFKTIVRDGTPSQLKHVGSYWAGFGVLAIVIGFFINAQFSNVLSGVLTSLLFFIGLMLAGSGSYLVYLSTTKKEPMTADHFDDDFTNDEPEPDGSYDSGEKQNDDFDPSAFDQEDIANQNNKSSNNHSSHRRDDDERHPDDAFLWDILDDPKTPGHVFKKILDELIKRDHARKS